MQRILKADACVEIVNYLFFCILGSAERQLCSPAQERTSIYLARQICTAYVHWDVMLCRRSFKFVNCVVAKR